MKNGFRTGMWMRLAPVLMLMLACLSASAQTATAVPQLDLKQFLRSWYVQAWIPEKKETRCASHVLVLYADGEGADSFQRGTFCQRKDNITEEWDATGRTDKSGGGKLETKHWFFFHQPLWVLAVGANYDWALVGTPNHKKLRVLSKDPKMNPDVLTGIERQAVAQGFDTSKLVQTPHDLESY